MSGEYDPDDPQEAERIELKLAQYQIRHPGSDAEFYAAVRLLIARSHDLQPDDLRELAEAIPLKRGRGRQQDHERRLAVWAEYFTFIGILRRGKRGDPQMPKDEALTLICQQYGMKRDAARKLYEDIARKGP